MASRAHPSVVVIAEGPDKESARGAATASLADDAVVDPAAWQRALAQQGHRGAVAPQMRDAKKQRHLLDRLRRAAGAVNADEVIVVLTNRSPKAHYASLYVIDPASEEAPAEVRVRLSGANADLTHAVDRALADRAPPAKETRTVAHPADTPDTAPVADATVSPTAAPASDAAVDAARTSKHAIGEELFQVSVGIEGGERRFKYADPLTRNLRTYQLNAAPAVAAQGELYPIAAAHVLQPGVVLGYARAFALKSSSSDGTAMDTQWSHLYAGARLRLRLRPGTERDPIVGLTGAYGQELFAISAAPGVAPPAVDYRFVRVSADVRVPFGRAAAFATAGYLFVLSAGDVAARFPKSNVGGVMAELGGSFALSTSLEARVTASYRRFFYAMNPTPGDTYVAGGALDEFGDLQAGVAYVY
jgi:hypothetical protein